MKIAICDDEQLFNTKTKSLLNSMLKEPSECEITICLSGEELVARHKGERFDIIFLDIAMGGMNGIAAAGKIREIDNNVIIAFITNHPEFALDGYEVGACRYIIKSRPENIYQKQIRAVLDEYSQKHKCFVISKRCEKICIFLKDIYFFEVRDKIITVHASVKEYEYTGRLSEVERRLGNDASFIKTHKSYIVNAAQIDTVKNFDILMKNNESVPMSRGLKKSVTKKYISYMTGR